MRNYRSIKINTIDAAYMNLANTAVSEGIEKLSRAIYLCYLFDFENDEMCKRAREHRDRLIELEEYSAINSKNSPTTLASEYWRGVWKAYRSEVINDGVKKLSAVPLQVLENKAEDKAYNAIIGKGEVPKPINEEAKKRAKYRYQKRQYESQNA